MGGIHNVENIVYCCGQIRIGMIVSDDLHSLIGGDLAQCWPVQIGHDKDRLIIFVPVRCKGLFQKQLDPGTPQPLINECVIPGNGNPVKTVDVMRRAFAHKTIAAGFGIVKTAQHDRRLLRQKIFQLAIRKRQLCALPGIDNMPTVGPYHIDQTCRALSWTVIGPVWLPVFFHENRLKIYHKVIFCAHHYYGISAFCNFLICCIAAKRYICRFSRL